MLKTQEIDNSSKMDPAEWLEYFKKLKTFEPLIILKTLNMIVLTLKKYQTLLNWIFRSQAKKSLKNRKASGPDEICNELLKYHSHVILTSLLKLFNMILTSGHYPTSWTEGYIKPLHKKDDALNPGNYRGITMTSVIGKLFNAIINRCLIDFLQKHKLMREEQIDFENKCRTFGGHVGDIFVIKTLIDKYKRNHFFVFRRSPKSL